MKGVGLYFVTILILLLILMMVWNQVGQQEVWLSDQEAKSLLEAGSIGRIEIEPIRVGNGESGRAVFYLEGTNGGQIVRYFFVSNVETFRDMLSSSYESIPVYSQPLQEDSILVRMLPYLMVLLVGIIVLVIVNSRAQGGGGGGGKMMNFGRSQARMITKANNPVTFQHVAGSYEEKEEMQEIVDFLKNPARFSALGARIPKGVILVGPPGTGKTFLAKAVAGEAGVPFFSISGSDFVEMFVGVGASRVRDLFDQAKRHAPCIVFIDEIDAVGRRRGAGLGGGHDEREQTLNQLLVEMDGFTVNQGVIVMAATNRVDILDPALLRPGRFDRQIVVNRPDIQGRREVLNLYAKGKPMGDDVDLDSIARITAGFTPADL